MGEPPDLVAPDVIRVRDTCNVYVLRAGNEATLIDFGSGSVLDRLGELGVERVTDVLLTHHHRDQAQGLARAVAAGIRVWAPPVELDLLARADEHWRVRPVENDYDLRQDRFSVLEPVPVAGAVDEYRTRRYGGVELYALPTPGHTAGSVTYLLDAGGRRLAFSGDLVYGPGKVWSLAATQWSYSGIEGQAATVVSCAVLAGRGPDLLLPAHGEPIEDPPEALGLLRERLSELLNMRRDAPWNLDDLVAHPWAPVTEHLLRNRASFANSYALVSESGGALLIDFGYDVVTGLVPSTRRPARRALLWPVEALRRDHGVERIEAVVTTHYHDDHVAGINLLRAVEGAEVWSPANVAPILADPSRYDLPCLWYEAVPVDRTLVLGEPVAWHEYELTAHELAGHTLYQAAIAFEVDGRRVLATGDQQATDGPHPILNYQYRNRFRFDDYVRSARLYRELRPDLIVSGHWFPCEVTDELLDRLEADGERLAELHRELLPLEEVDLGAEGFAARSEPYRLEVAAGDTVDLDVTVRNPFRRQASAVVRLVAPAGWGVAPPEQEASLAAGGEATLRFRVTPDGPAARARVAADVTVDDVPFGQQAEALVTVA